MRTVLSYSRYLFFIAVISTLLIALGLFVFGGVLAVNTLLGLIRANLAEPEAIKDLAVGSIKVIDLFLLATVAYIVALGLYELFIKDDLDLPKWLEIHTLDDLKSKLVGVIIVIVAVFFLERLATWKGPGYEPLVGGLSSAAVITALTFFLWKGTEH